MQNFSNTIIVPYFQDLLDVASANIIQNNKDLLPNLCTITIFLPNKLPQTQLQNSLLAHAERLGHTAVLLPNCTTLRQWAFTNNVPHKPVLSQYARELILVDAINQQPNLFSNANPWAIASELFALFDGMALNDVDQTRLDDYLCKSSSRTSTTLSQEAELVTTLWKAWQEQLSHENVLDPIDAYIQALLAIESTKDKLFYCIGLDKLFTREISALHKLDQQSQLHIYLSASSPTLSTRPDTIIKKLALSQNQEDHTTIDKISSYTKFFDSVFLNSDLSIKQRAKIFSDKHLISPIDKQLNIYKTNSLEQHVKAIDIKIRSYIYHGKENIGVVTADRKLARRLRAVLEHANILVNDIGGWALSTTSAATILEYWLQLIEEKYPTKQLVTIARSPFFPILVDKKLHNQAIDFLEKEIILAFNLHNGLNVIRTKLDDIHNDQDDINNQILDYLYAFIDKIEASTHNIVRLCTHESIPIHRYFEETFNALKTIGIYSELNKDEAGRQTFNCLETQITHFKKIENKMSWAEWRRFLVRILDQQNFKPSIVSTNVTFCSLEQSRLLKFDALIIASVDKSHFPGPSINYVFFNEYTRTELNIPTWKDEHYLYFYLFRKLLDAAPDILITVQTEYNDEKISPSPWLEAIETFHYMAYGKNLNDELLQELVIQENTCVVNAEFQIPLPTLSYQPSPALNDELKLSKISISDYQNLVNCPYQFFTSTALNLSKTNKLSEELEKADFGSLIHKCIHTFFTSGSSVKKITDGNREDNESALQAISVEIFNKFTDQSFSNKLWLQRWLNLIPSFIGWEINRQKNFIPYKHEITLKSDIADKKTLSGRIDRIDQSKAGYAIVDYKTGQTPTKKSILAGEQVQLPMYALLNKDCNQVEYIVLGKNNRVKSEAIIKDEQLSELVRQHTKRLSELTNNLENDAKFSAFADDDICEWCEARGLCRKDYWEN